MSANRLKTEKTEQDIEANSLAWELASLFGPAVLNRAMNSRVEELDFTPDEVVSATRELRRLADNPDVQQLMAQCLPDDLQVVLCMWLLDPGMQGKVLTARSLCLQ